VDAHGQARIAARRMSEYLRLARAVYGTDTQMGEHLGVTGTLLQRLSRFWNGVTLTRKPHNQNQAINRDHDHDRERSRSSA
jgi:hypothetical protein